MCGRFSFSTSKEKINNQLKVVVPTPVTPNYNIAPGQQAAVITNTNPTTLSFFTWGLIPYWSKSDIKSTNLINARIEGIASKPSFRIPVRKRRCLILADGFYEWKKIANQKKPYRIILKDQSILTFAGIWDEWINPQNEKIQTFSIITTAPNKDMQYIHNRMPAVLINEQQRSKWLQEENYEQAISMIKPLRNGLLKTYPVSPMVNSYKANFPELYNPISESPTLFD